MALLAVVLALGAMLGDVSAQCVNGVCNVGGGFAGSIRGRVVERITANDYGIQLAPGEVLISVDGVPVNQVQPGPIRSIVRVVATAAVTLADSLIVNRSERAYLHALREAEILARRRTAGHPLGVAPGCRYSGTGISLSADRPNHCYLEELPESRLVARAMVRGSDGRFYWSAHYR